MTRLTLYEWGLRLAELTAQRSTCLRRQVGCVLLSYRGHVLATGYNGVASKEPHCNEGRPGPSLVGIGDMIYDNACEGAFEKSGTGLDKCKAIHAEQNALLQCRDVYEIEMACVTASPCITCIKLLLNTECRTIVYGEEYPHSEAKRLWTQAGRVWVQM